MADGDPVKINLASAKFTLESAETGVIIQSFDMGVESNLKQVWDQNAGAYKGYVFYDFRKTQDFNAIVNGTTGLAIAQPGVALTLSNDLGIGAAKNGVAAGTIFTTGVRISAQPEELRMVSGNTLQRATIVAA